MYDAVMYKMNAYAIIPFIAKHSLFLCVRLFLWPQVRAANNDVETEVTDVCSRKQCVDPILMQYIQGRRRFENPARRGSKMSKMNRARSCEHSSGGPSKKPCPVTAQGANRWSYGLAGLLRREAVDRDSHADLDLYDVKFPLALPAQWKAVFCAAAILLVRIACFSFYNLFCF